MKIPRSKLRGIFKLKRATDLAFQAIDLKDTSGLPELDIAQIYLLEREHAKIDRLDLSNPQLNQSEHCMKSFQQLVQNREISVAKRKDSSISQGTICYIHQLNNDVKIFHSRDSN